MVVAECERRVEQIRRGEGKEPEEKTDPFSFVVRTKIQRWCHDFAVVCFHGAVDGGSGVLVGYGQRSITRQTGWGLNLLLVS